VQNISLAGNEVTVPLHATLMRAAGGVHPLMPGYFTNMCLLAACSLLKGV